jgi:carbonic anhydrase
MDLEVHFVHTQAIDTSSLAVIGVFFDVLIGGGKDNPFITSLLSAINSSEDADPTKHTLVEVKDFFD